MLTPDQAERIAEDSFRMLSASTGVTDFAALDEGSRESLAYMIASAPTVGVLRFQHTIDPNKLVDALVDRSRTSSISALAEQVMSLASGKLCSNTASPHEQTYPYPAKCPKCGALVL